MIHKGWLTIVSAILLLIMAEFFLQVRAHIRHGNSMITKLMVRLGDEGATSLYQYDKKLNLMRLRPNLIHRTKEIEIVTNSVGLRSPEISPHKREGEFRFAVIGASTIQGAYAKDNSATFAYLLAKELNQKNPELDISFVNAGIAGYTVADQHRLYESIVSHYHPDLAIIYTGVNDFSSLCQSKPLAGTDYGIPTISLPKWVLTYELITKNTQLLKPQTTATLKNLDAIHADHYEANLAKLIDAALESGAEVYLLSNAKSYRKDMPLAEQQQLSAISTYYYSCLDLQRLYIAYERFNNAVEHQSKRKHVVYIDTEQIIPGGKMYFVDPVHFTKLGETQLANTVASIIQKNAIQTKTN